ncbi:MAG: hypothetical protein ACRDJC_18270 [Thermomicrobiales bacterium]
MISGLTGQTTGLELRELARRNGLELSEADARDLQPYYDQHQRWLEQLRRVLDDDEEPATLFSAVGAHDVRE